MFIITRIRAYLTFRKAWQAGIDSGVINVSRLRQHYGEKGGVR